MENPRTYYGYDDKNNLITSETAEDAKKDIDPNEIKEKAENVISVVNDEMTKISNALDGVINDVDNALIVKGKSMKADVDRAIGLVDSTKGEIIGKIDCDKLYSNAIEIHDRLQKTYNSRAQGHVRATTGVVIVREQIGMER